MKQAKCDTAVNGNVTDIQYRLQTLFDDVFTKKSHKDYKICCDYAHFI